MSKLSESARFGWESGRVAARRVLNRTLPYAVISSVFLWMILSHYGWNYYECVLALALALGVFGGFYGIKVRYELAAKERAEAEAEKEKTTAPGSAR